MKEIDKKFLIKDLCQRLPYGVQVEIKPKVQEQFTTLLDTFFLHLFLTHTDDDIFDDFSIVPYLRPMSSMTEEEDKEFALLQTNTHNSGFLYAIDAANMINWLNAHHFDYCGLIEKGLALKAPEDMYID